MTLRWAEWKDHREDIDAVVTSPASEREVMRERRDAEAAAWRRLFETVEA